MAEAPDPVRDLPDEVVRLRDRHRDFYLDYLAETAETATHHSDGWLASIDSDYPNIRSALRWSLDRGDHASAIRLCAGLYPYWRLRHLLREGLKWFEESLSSETTDPDSLFRMYTLHFELARFGDARRVLQEVLERAEKLGDDAMAAKALVEISWCDHHSGAKADISQIERAVAVSRKTGDEKALVEALNALAWNLRAQFRFYEARPYMEEALELTRRHGTKRELADMLGSYTNLVAALWDYEARAAALLEAIDIYEEIGDWYWACEKRTQLARGLERQGHLTGALRLLEETLDVAQRKANAITTATVLERLSDWEFKYGSIDRADGMAREVMDLLENVGDLTTETSYLRPSSCWMLSQCAAAQGDRQRLKDLATRYLDLQLEGDYVEKGRTAVVTGTAEWLYEFGESNLAMQILTYGQWKLPRDGEITELMLAETRAKLQRDWNAAAELRERLIAVQGREPETLGPLTEIHLRRGDFARARELAAEIFSLVEGTGRKGGEAQAALLLARVARLQGDEAELEALDRMLIQRWLYLFPESSSSSCLLAEHLAESLAARRLFHEAVRLAAGARRWRERRQLFPLPDEPPPRDFLAEARKAMGEESLTKAWAEGFGSSLIESFYAIAPGLSKRL